MAGSLLFDFPPYSFIAHQDFSEILEFVWLLPHCCRFPSEIASIFPEMLPRILSPDTPAQDKKALRLLLQPSNLPVSRLSSAHVPAHILSAPVSLNTLLFFRFPGIPISLYTESATEPPIIFGFLPHWQPSRPLRPHNF